MSGQMDLEQRLDQLLADRGDRLPDRVIDAVVLEIADIDQRRTWRAPWRTSPMLKYAGLAAATVLVVVGGAVLTSVGAPQPPPTNAPIASATTQPSPSPTRSPVPVPTPFRGSSLPSAGSIVDSLEHPAGNEWITAAHGSLWVPGTEGGVLTRVDTATTDRRPIDLGAFNQALAASDAGVWVTLGFDFEIVLVDQATNEVVDRIPTPGYSTYAAALDGERLWATVYSTDNPDSEGVIVIDTANGEILHWVDLGGYGTTGIAIGGGYAWVALNATGMLAQIDLDTYEVVGQAFVGSSPLMVAYGFDAAWVAPRRGNAIYRVGPDRATTQIVMPTGDEETYVSRATVGVAVDQGGVWATTGLFDGCDQTPDADYLVRIDPATNTVIASTAMTCAGGIAVDETGDVWVSAGSRLLRVRPE